MLYVDEQLPAFEVGQLIQVELKLLIILLLSALHLELLDNVNNTSELVCVELCDFELELVSVNFPRGIGLVNVLAFRRVVAIVSGLVLIEVLHLVLSQFLVNLLLNFVNLVLILSVIVFNKALAVRLLVLRLHIFLNALVDVNFKFLASGVRKTEQIKLKLFIFVCQSLVVVRVETVHIFEHNGDNSFLLSDGKVSNDLLIEPLLQGLQV